MRLERLVSGCLLCVLAGAAQAQEVGPDVRLSEAISALGSPIWTERSDAIETLRLAGAEALPSLVRAASDPDPEVAFQAARLRQSIESDLRLLERVHAWSPWADPDLASSLSTRGPGALERLCSTLASASGWRDAIAIASFLDFRGDATGVAREVERRFEAAPGVARQNLLFLMAHAHPEGLSFCRRVAAGEMGADGADRFEAVLALAFGGDAAALASISALDPPFVSEAFAGDRGAVPDLEAYASGLEDARDRARLVAYRCYELLIGRCYFHHLEFLFRQSGGYGPSPLRCLPLAGDLDEAARARALLARFDAFLRLFPGHPGSDDAALEGARLALFTLGDRPLATRWLARGFELPDGERRGAIDALLRCSLHVELSVAELDRLAPSIAPGSMRDRFDYARLLARARMEGPGAALDLLARIDRPRAPWRGEDGVRQVGLWREWLAREEAFEATDPADVEARAARLYAIAAHFYHNREILRPIDLSDTWHGWWIAYATARGEAGTAPGLDWVLASHHLSRAARLFARLRADYPDASVMDKTLFSEGLCYHKMKDEKACNVHWDQRLDWETLTRRHVELFLELVRRFPESNLADDAARSVDYQIQMGNYRPER